MYVHHDTASSTYIIGASLSEPHTSDTTYFRSVRLCIYICIRTSLPPEAPDACAHGSVVLILAHLCAVCSRLGKPLSEVLGLAHHDAEVGDQSFKACKVRVKPFASIALPCFALDRVQLTVDVSCVLLAVHTLHAAASPASSRRLAPNDAPASTLVCIVAVCMCFS